MTMPPVNIQADTDNIDIRQYLGLIWQWAWLIILITILAGVIAFFVSQQITPIYQASTTLLVNEAPSTRTTDYTSVLASERLTRTYAEMMLTQPILATVNEQLTLGVNFEALRSSISVEPIKDTQLIQIKIDSIDPNRAAMIANTLVSVFSSQIQSLQAERFMVSKQSLQDQLANIDSQIQHFTEQLARTSDATERDRIESNAAQYRQIYSNLLLSLEQVRLAEAQTTSTVVQVEPAIPNSTPIRPKIINNTVIAALLAMLLTIGLIFTIEALDDTIKTPDEVNKILHQPVLALIAHHTFEEGKPITEAQPRSPVSEAFRTLRTNVQYASVDRPLRTLLITSPDPGEGKTTIAVNLALVLAQSGRRVILIDADLRRPAIHRQFRLPNKMGLSTLFFQSEVKLDGILQLTRIPNLSLITSGDLPPNPSELLGSQKMHLILEKTQALADVVIIDTPPTLAVTDASVLMQVVDGALLIIQPGVTRMGTAMGAIEQFQRVGSKILGVVFNNVELSRGRYRYRYYKDYHGYGSYYYYKGYRDDQRSHRNKK